MTTTLLAAEAELSKQIGDYWTGTTTSDGAAGGTTLIDTALKAKQNGWVTKETYDMLTEESVSAADIYEERLVSSLDNSSGALTVLAHGGKIESGINYRVHRLFSASAKRIALVAAARRVFPFLHGSIWDESLVSGNWLKDGSFEVWTSATALTHWTTSGSTLAQTSTSLYYEHGGYSCKQSTAVGYIQQSISNFDDLKYLRGKAVTFSVRGWSDAASCLRISINDGVNDETYSSYHDGDSAWTKHSDPLKVTQVIADNATDITFKIYHAVAAPGQASYVDDGRVISGHRGKLYIGNLGLAQDKPLKVEIEPTSYSQDEEWLGVRDYVVDGDGYLYIPTDYATNRRLRIRGTGYLDFLASGVSSTDWTATIAIDSPQLDILVAEAALYLYTTMALPNAESGEREAYQEMMAFWEKQSTTVKSKFRMKSPGVVIHWGVH